ncbi:hypothetical protein Q5P01_018194 [Channa striata]|uniref:Uncharacterized protein n=1 Tax=Channa striata TaxID=64152 RepID=A0AA88M7D1_CHASR|nr:hypothetical protein Q5P01_018194 [Channa striata]
MRFNGPDSRRDVDTSGSGLKTSRSRELSGRIRAPSGVAKGGVRLGAMQTLEVVCGEAAPLMRERDTKRGVTADLVTSSGPRLS